MSLIVVIFCLVAFSNSIFTSSEVIIDETHRQDVIDYVNEIKSNIDVTVDPCDNFRGYACGNIKPKANPLRSLNTIVNENKAEKLVRDLYLNCQDINKNPRNYTTIIKNIFEQIDILSPFKKFPVPVKELDLNSSHIAELESHLLAMGFGNLIQLRPAMDDKSVILLVPSDVSNIEHSLFLLELWNNNNISTTSEEDKVAIQDVLKFLNDYKNLFNKPIEEFKQNDSNETYALNELKDILPSENINWETINQIISKILNLDTTNPQYKFRIVSVDFFKNLIKLVDNTDIETLINFEIFKYVQKFRENAECTMFKIITKYVFLKKIWNENLSSQERTVGRYTKFLNDFESSLNITLKNIPNDYDNVIVENIKTIRFILINYEKSLNNNIMDDIFENYEEGKFYKISMLVQQNLIKAKFDYNSGKDVSTFNLIIGDYEEAIELHNKNKPYLYYYNVMNFKLWYSYFEFYQYHGKNSKDQFYKCLKKIKWDDSLNWVDSIFISTYTTIKRILNNYDTNDLLKGELSIVNELMDTRKLFFISITQNICKKPNPYDLYKVRVLPHLKEFTDAFECSEKTKINAISKDIRCDFSTCPNDYEYLKEFLPYKINQC